MNGSDFSELYTLLSNAPEERLSEDIRDFFREENLESYRIPDIATELERNAIACLFDEEKEIPERIKDAREIDPLCIEAFYLELCLSEDTSSYHIFGRYDRMKDAYPSFTPYGKENYRLILDFYVEFLLDMHNITQGIRVQK